jgi:hypothetical protein
MAFIACSAWTVVTPRRSRARTGRDQLGSLFSPEGELVAGHVGDGLEHLVLADPVEHGGIGGEPQLTALRRLEEAEEPIRLRERQRPKEDPIDDGGHRDRRTEAEGEQGDDGEGVARGTCQPAQPPQLGPNPAGQGRDHRISPSRRARA